jgi:hypothetical protein
VFVFCVLRVLKDHSTDTCTVVYSYLVQLELWSKLMAVFSMRVLLACAKLGNTSLLLSPMFDASNVLDGYDSDDDPLLCSSLTFQSLSHSQLRAFESSPVSSEEAHTSTPATKSLGRTSSRFSGLEVASNSKGSSRFSAAAATAAGTGGVGRRWEDGGGHGLEVASSGNRSERRDAPGLCTVENSSLQERVLILSTIITRGTLEASLAHLKTTNEEHKTDKALMNAVAQTKRCHSDIAKIEQASLKAASDQLHLVASTLRLKLDDACDGNLQDAVAKFEAMSGAFEWMISEAYPLRATWAEADENGDFKCNSCQLTFSSKHHLIYCTESGMYKPNFSSHVCFLW